MLPVKEKAQLENPRRLFLFSHTKVGKTTLASALPNNLIIDFEDGAEFLDAIRFNVVKEHNKSGIGKYKLLESLANEIKAANKVKGDYVYDFITYDTATSMEDLASVIATRLYRKSAIGKNFEGEDVVRELAQGAGYPWLHKAFKQLYNLFYGLSRNGLIILGHVKQASLLKAGKELQAKDIALTGKLKLVVTADCDGIGYLYRDKEDFNKVMISFRTNELDLATGSRLLHLRNQEFLISELDTETNEIKTYWEKIYKNLN